MSNVKILMALLAACILVMPAISMPDNGNPTIGQDCRQIPPMMGDGAQNPQGCPCQTPMIGPNGEDGKQKFCNDRNSTPGELEQDNQQ